MGQDPLILQRVNLSSMTGVISSLAGLSDCARKQGEARKGALSWEIRHLKKYLAT